MRIAKLVAAVIVASVGLAGMRTNVAVGQEKKPTAAGKPDPTWNQDNDLPSVFPDIKPLGAEEVGKFAAARVPVVLEDDPPLIKLRKAKLRLAIKELEKQIAFRQLGGNPNRSFEDTAERFADSGQAVISCALEIATTENDRRAWLEFGVGLHKEFEQFVRQRVNQGIALPTILDRASRNRLDAEIALQKYLDESNAK